MEERKRIAIIGGNYPASILAGIFGNIPSILIAVDAASEMEERLDSLRKIGLSDTNVEKIKELAIEEAKGGESVFSILDRHIECISKAITPTRLEFDLLPTMPFEPTEPKQKNRMGFLDGLNYRGSKHQNQRFSQHFKK